MESPRTHKKGWSMLIQRAVLVSIVILGAVFRFYNLNWDSGHYFHPDERNIDIAVGRIHFFQSMNPEFFAYGSVPVYLYRAGADLVTSITKDASWTNDWGKLNLIGRYFSAFFSTVTIFLVYILTRSFFSAPAALAASWFIAITPILIQQAHYGVTESMLGFWAVLLTLLSISVIKKKDWVRTILLGYVYALAVATKASAISFGIIPLTAIIWGTATSHGSKKLRTTHAVGLLFLFLVVSTLSYLAISPYTFLAWDKFIESMRYEDGVVSGRLVVVYVYQFLHTVPYLFQLTQLQYTQGYTLAIASLGGYVWLLVESVKRKKWVIPFIFLWPTLYTLYVGGWFTKFVRYLVPIYPFLAVAAGYFVLKLFVRVKKISTVLASIVLGFFLFAPLVHSVAFMHIYIVKQTRIAASEWIYANIPTKSKLLTEHWDDGLPVSLSPKRNPSLYQIDQLTIYEPDNEQKIVYYAEKLSSHDYVIINSRRLYGTLIHLTDKYPITSKYYKLLFNGALGYTKVSEFAVYPTIPLGSWMITLNDDASEETVQVYDHPKVMIFQNTGHLSVDRLTTILTQ